MQASLTRYAGWLVLLAVLVGLGALLAAGHVGALFLAVALLALVLLTLTDPRLGLVAWIACFAIIPNWAGSPQLSAVEILTLALVATLALSRFMVGRLGVPPGFVLPLVVFVSGVLLSLSVHHTVGELFWGVALCAFVPLAFAVGWSLGPREREGLIQATMWVAAGLGALAFIAALNGKDPYALVGIHTPAGLAHQFRGGHLRIALGFGTPIALGGFLALGFALSLSRARHLISVLAGIGVLATLSRGPIAAALLALLAFWMVRRITPPRLGAMGLVVLAVFYAPLGIAQTARHSFVQTYEPGRTEERGNALARVTVTKAGFAVARKSAISGHGLGAVSSGRSQLLKSNGKTYSDVTSQYISFAVEGGFLPLIGFAWILVLLALRLRRRAALGVVIGQASLWATVALTLSLPIFFLVAGATLAGEGASRTPAP